MLGPLRRHPIGTYVALAYVLSWACWLPLVMSRAVVGRGTGWPTDLPGLAGPATAAILTSWLTGGRPAVIDLWRRVARWRVPLWCWGYVAGTAFLGATTAIVGANGRLGHGWSSYTGAGDLGLVPTFLLVFVVNGIGEEAGWRGFLAHHLLQRHDPIATSALVAVVWAGWHLPLFVVVGSFRDMGVTAVGWLVGLSAGSLVLTWLYVGSRESILVVALWHTVLNFSSGTERMSGPPAAVVSSSVMVLAVVLLVGRHAKGARPRTQGVNGT